MDKFHSPSDRTMAVTAIGYSSPSTGKVEIDVNPVLLQGSVEITYTLAVICLVRTLTNLIKVSREKA